MGSAEIWHNGWECYYSENAQFFTGEGWLAYKGGVDLDAPSLSASTLEGLLSDIADYDEPDPNLT